MRKKELQLVSFKQAKRLKAAGFDLENIKFYSLDGTKGFERWEFGAYTNEEATYMFAFPMPTVALALKWFRDVKMSICTVFYNEKQYKGEYTFLQGMYNYTDSFDTYEAAESALLDKLLTLIKK